MQWLPAHEGKEMLALASGAISPLMGILP